jgi:small subunit ribosomal protein S6
LAQKLYECMFLLDSGKWAVDPQGTEQAIRDILGRCGAEIVHLTPFQEGRLAFEIDGHKKGLHLLTYFKMDGSKVDEMNRLCKLSGPVIRHMVIQHPKRLFDLMADALRQHAEGGAPAEPAAVGV